MPNNKRFILFWSLIGALVLLMIWLLWSPRVDWDENLQPQNKNPYGTYMLRTLLENVRHDQGFVDVTDSLANRMPADPNAFKVDNYIFLGNNFFGDREDQNKLLEFVSKGNNAYLLMEDPRVFLGQLLENHDLPAEDEDQEVPVYSLIDDILQVYADSVLRMTHVDRLGKEWKYNLKKYIDHEVVMRDWNFFQLNQSQLEYFGIKVIGSFDGYMIHALAVPYGEGWFYFHCTPLVFTNYYLKQKEGMEFVRSYMSHLGDGMIYWDEENRHYQLSNRMEEEEGYNELGKPSEGPLEFVLSQPNLRRAWYLALVLALFYLLFAGRRLQRAIPTVTKPKNTSIEFAEVVSQLFLKQSDHSKLVRMKMELWRAYVREKYRIAWPEMSYLMTFEQVAEIAAKSGIEEGVISDLITNYNTLQMAGSVSTEAMLELHNKLEYYYQNCK